MSDEFIKVATKEIREEISELEKILSKCTSDNDIVFNASEFQKHTHKIKGLAPMMGNSSLGDLAASLDSIFKIILQKPSINGVFQILQKIIPSMKSVMTEPDFDPKKLNEKIIEIENILN